MKFCNICGFKIKDSDKFCQNCGETLYGNKIKNSISKIESYSLDKREKLQERFNIIFSLCGSDFLLMKFEKENGWSSLFQNEETSTVVFIYLFIVMFYGFIYFSLKYKCIEKCKPTWALIAFLTYLGMGLLGFYEPPNYANYNWADWTAEVTSIIELFLMYNFWTEAKSDDSIL